MELSVITVDQATATNSVPVSEKVFGGSYNEALIHQIVTAYLANGRAGTKAQKTRTEVKGSGAKPWRQKGTGRARAGTIRSPIWRGGGRAFAAKPRSFAQKINKKMYQGALRSIFSELTKQQRLQVIEDLQLNVPKTKELVSQLQALNLKDVLVITKALDENLVLAARNLPNVDVCEVNQVDPVNLIAFENVLVTVPALKQIEEWLG